MLEFQEAVVAVDYCPTPCERQGVELMNARSFVGKLALAIAPLRAREPKRARRE